MIKILKNIMFLILIQACFLMPVFGIDLDHTVDDAIRKNYNVTPQQLPISQPKNVQQKTTQTQKTQPKATQTQSSQPLPKLPNPPKKYTTSTKTYTQQNIKKQQPITSKSFHLRKGMKFDIINSVNISDKQRAGTNISFATSKPIKTAYCTIPQGTKFVGKITESHPPQLTGNGGLVSLEISTIILNGRYQKINTKIIKVNNKRVYWGDIKGKRKYWKNTVAKGKWGRNVFKKTNRVSASLAKDKATVILSPFTFLYGALAGTVSTAVSPVLSIFYKGESLYIPAGTKFQIKFCDDVKLYY